MGSVASARIEDVVASADEGSREMRALRRSLIARTEQLLAAREELRVLDRMKRDFVTLVAHEMRTPLTSIIGVADIALHGLYESHEELVSLLATVQSEGTRLGRFVADAIEFLQWVSGDASLARETFDLRVQIEEVVRAVSANYEDKSVSATVWTPRRLEMETDLRSLTMCLERVIDNAFKFSEGDAQIRIKVEVTPVEGREEWVTIRVLDHGCGIDPERLDELYRAMSLCYSPWHHTRGGGLSLALVREILWRHGGTIRIESDGIGEGCEAVMSLPRRVTPSSEQQRRSADC